VFTHGRAFYSVYCQIVFTRNLHNELKGEKKKGKKKEEKGK
jgi:hypothetical protein